MTKTYKIGVNGWFFCKPFTGIGRYSINMFSEIAGLYPEFEFYIAIPEKLPEIVDKSLRYQNNIKFELIPENSAMKLIYPGISKSFAPPSVTPTVASPAKPSVKPMLS